MEDSGVFSVRSAYVWLKKIAEQPQTNRRGEPSSANKTQLFWRRIWRLKIQTKVKVFAWRVFHNFLPSAYNLAKRHCDVSLKCPVCCWERETTTHALLSCW
ncbi:hypothetical protein QQ045_026846 [Rhodiola kirilowii]